MPAAPDPSLDLRTLNASFRLALLGENKSERTVEAYTDAVRFFADFLEASGHPLTVTAITRDHIRGFIADQLKRWKPATAHNRYRGLHSFFTCAVDELEELPSHPMNGMKPPTSQRSRYLSSPTTSSGDSSKPARARTSLPVGIPPSSGC
jgi:site-specific recombinase XerD